jgi:sn-glycerol 3-phosphate transport system substrate-binding protein
MKIQAFAVAAGLGAALLSSTSAFAATEIAWWHAMGGELGQKLEQIVKGFNDSQSDYKVVPTYKGSYPETMTAAIAAFRAKQQPAIVQVFEVGTGTMMSAKGAVYPVYQLMKDAGEPFDPKGFLQAVVGYYTDTDGNMLSMPFNSSTPILYYNKDVFKKAGLDPEQPPKTWADMAEYSKKIMDSGAAKCGFTSGWISWVQTENFSAWHNQPMGTLANGFGGLGTEFLFGKDKPLVKHWANLAEWQKSGVFSNGGPVGGNDAPPKFYIQECAMYMNSSASRAGVVANSKDFEVGYGMLPYYDDVEGAPQNTIIGGATLWVLQGVPQEQYKGVAKFFSYLSSAEVQADWHQFSGYLPITQAAYDLGKTQGFYDKNPGTEVAIKEITLNPPTENSKGLRFGNYVQIRDIIDEEFQKLLSGSEDAQAALDNVDKRGNVLLREFEAANKLHRRRPASSRAATYCRYEARDLRTLGLALAAACAAAYGDHHLLPVAGRSGGQAELPARGRLRIQVDVCRLQELHRAAPRSQLSEFADCHGGLRCVGFAGVAHRRPGAGARGGSGGERRYYLLDLPGLALRRRARRSRHHVVVHLQSHHRHHSLHARYGRLSVEPRLEVNRRDDPRGDRRRMAARLIQLPVLPCRAAVDPRLAEGSRGH